MQLWAGLSALSRGTFVTWGFAPGWYRARRLALDQLLTTRRIGRYFSGTSMISMVSAGTVCAWVS